MAGELLGVLNSCNLQLLSAGRQPAGGGGTAAARRRRSTPAAPLGALAGGAQAADGARICRDVLLVLAFELLQGRGVVRGEAGQGEYQVSTRYASGALNSPTHKHTTRPQQPHPPNQLAPTTTWQHSTAQHVPG